MAAWLRAGPPMNWRDIRVAWTSACAAPLSDRILDLTGSSTSVAHNNGVLSEAGLQQSLFVLMAVDEKAFGITHVLVQVIYCGHMVDFDKREIRYRLRDARDRVVCDLAQPWRMVPLLDFNYVRRF